MKKINSLSKTDNGNVHTLWDTPAGEFELLYTRGMMDLLAADLGDDLAEYRSILDEVAATYVPPEPEPPYVPASVTIRQARLALLGAGLLASVDAAIDGMPSQQKEAARIEWEYATEVQRSSGLVPMIGAALGLDDAALDALFIEAAAL